MAALDIAGEHDPARHTGLVRIAIQVRPDAAHSDVGGEHDCALVVRVSARAVDGPARPVLSGSRRACFQCQD
jgi:uncharacterized protein YggU (UPF0235/DUF167 family)